MCSTCRGSVTCCLPLQVNPLHVKLPLDCPRPLPRGSWVNLLIDMNNIAAVLPHKPGFRSLDGIVLHASCKVRFASVLHDLMVTVCISVYIRRFAPVNVCIVCVVTRDCQSVDQYRDHSLAFCPCLPFYCVFLPACHPADGTFGGLLGASSIHAALTSSGLLWRGRRV